MNFEQKIRELHPKAYAWAEQCCGFAPELARDVLQESYLKVLEGRAVFHGRSAFKTWLFAIIRHTALDHFREQERHRKTLEDLKAARDQENEPVYGEGEGKRMKHLFAQLSGRQQEVMSLVFYHGMTLEGAAEVMGVTVGSARTHYARGKERLKTMLQGQKDQIL